MCDGPDGQRRPHVVGPGRVRPRLRRPVRPAWVRLPAAEVTALDPVFRWTLHTARQALRDAGQADDDPARFGAVFGNLSFPSAGMAAYTPGHLAGRDSRVCEPSRVGIPDPRNRFSSGLPALVLERAPRPGRRRVRARRRLREQPLRGQARLRPVARRRGRPDARRRGELRRRPVHPPGFRRPAGAQPHRSIAPVPPRRGRPRPGRGMRLRRAAPAGGRRAGRRPDPRHHPRRRPVERRPRPRAARAVGGRVRRGPCAQALGRGRPRTRRHLAARMPRHRHPGRGRDRGALDRRGVSADARTCRSDRSSRTSGT